MTEMNIDDLAQKIYAASRIDGNFKLCSGQISNEYFDKYLFETEPEILTEISRQMIKLIPAGTEVLAGLEIGGIPIATALSIQTNIPAVFVRKKAKEYGTCKLAEGIDICDKNLCIIEDEVTIGGQILLSASDLKQLGARIKYVLCVIERDRKCRDNLRNKSMELLSLFTIEELQANSITRSLA
jgi:orotate phosphoribosyltransferase